MHVQSGTKVPGRRPVGVNMVRNAIDFSEAPADSLCLASLIVKDVITSFEYDSGIIQSVSIYCKWVNNNIYIINDYMNVIYK